MKYSLFRVNATSPVSWLIPASCSARFSLEVYSNVWYCQLPGTQSFFFYIGNVLPHNLDLNLPTTRFALPGQFASRGQFCQSDTCTPRPASTLVTGGAGNSSCVWSSESRGVAVPVGVSTPLYF